MQFSRTFSFSFSLLALIICFSSCPSSSTPDEPQPPTGPAVQVEKEGKVGGGPATPYFLFLADVHLDNARKATKYDTGKDLWAAAKQRLNSIVTSTHPPKFIIYTGDLTAHNSPHHDQAISLKKRQHYSATVLADLRKIADTTPLFFAPGNNDSFDGDYYAFTNPEDSSVFDLVSTLDYPAPNATIVSNPHPKDGYYSARPFDGLRIIALNSVILGYQHYGYPFDTDFQSIGDTMLTWLSTELADVKDKQEKAYIIMHIPPGIDAHDGYGNYLWDTLQNNLWQTRFLNLVDTFQHEIAGVLYGHTHMDELRQLASHSDPSIINEIAISSPGISPNHGQNPAFKTVTYEANTFELQDFITYYTDKDDVVWGPDSLRFSLVYSCQGKSIYDCLRKRDVNYIAADMVNQYNIYKTGKPGTTKSEVISGILVE